MQEFAQVYWWVVGGGLVAFMALFCFCSIAYGWNIARAQRKLFGAGFWILAGCLIKCAATKPDQPDVPPTPSVVTQAKVAVTESTTTNIVMNLTCSTNFIGLVAYPCVSVGGTNDWVILAKQPKQVTATNMTFAVAGDFISEASNRFVRVYFPITEPDGGQLVDAAVTAATAVQAADTDTDDDADADAEEGGEE